MAVLNAANEVAVECFLERRIRFSDIPELIGEVMERTSKGPANDLDAILAADQAARHLAVDLSTARVQA